MDAKSAEIFDLMTTDPQGTHGVHRWRPYKALDNPWGVYPRSEGPLAARLTARNEDAMASYIERKDDHIKRLRRIEGQVRGLQRMVDEEQYCIDILTQVAAATRALQAFSLDLLDEHLRSCLLDAAVRGGSEAHDKVQEASAAIARLVKS